MTTSNTQGSARQAQVFAAAALTFLCLLCPGGKTFGQEVASAHLGVQQNSGAAAESQSALHKTVRVDGELEIRHEDLTDGKSRNLYFVKRADGVRVPLAFTKEPPTHLLTGDQVRADGEVSGSGLLLYSGSTSLSKTKGSTTTTTTTTAGDATSTSSASSIPLPNTLGAQSTLVILVNFSDSAVQPYTAVDARNTFFTTASNFFMENSYGQTSITGDVVGWYTIPASISTCDTAQIATAAQNAAIAAGVNLSNYTRYVYAFPQDNACGFGGASDVGGTPSQSWVNGNSLDIHIIDHELGHAFGLWHSHFFDCGATATIGTSCAMDEYGDILDTMGAVAPWSPHYNAYQKERLGWLNNGASPSIQTVQGSGSYTIKTYELGSGGPNALKILKSTDPVSGAKTWYYLEARQSVGFDGFLTDGTCGQCATQNETGGVLFHVGTDGDGNTAGLLDMTPATLSYYWWFDPALAVGQTFQDSAAGVTVTTTSVDSAGATLQITLNGSPSCTSANPTVSISPGQSQKVSAGTAVNFTATIVDNDSSSCAPATFNLGDALPSGWNGMWSAAAVALSPGGSGSAILTVTSPLGTADGTYPLGVSATNGLSGSFSGSVQGSYLISTTPLSAVVSTNQSSYAAGQTVNVTVTMLLGTTPDVGAGATVTITPPNHRATTLNGTTGTSGTAVLNYKLSRRAAPGIYQVQLNPGVAGAAPTAGASTSFTVQ